MGATVQDDCKQCQLQFEKSLYDIKIDFNPHFLTMCHGVGKSPINKYNLSSLLVYLRSDQLHNGNKMNLSKFIKKVDFGYREHLHYKKMEERNVKKKKGGK